MFVRTLTKILLIAACAPAFAQVDERVAMELFSRDVHPFLRQNCAECHAGGGGYPSGPPHSHMDPRVAFGAFFKRINFENPERSTMFTMARNRHFCEEFGSCKESERRSTEVMQKIMQYISSVKTASLSASAANARESDSAAEANPYVRNYSPLKPIVTSPVKIRDDGSNRTLSYSLEGKAVLQVTLDYLKAGVYQISEIALAAPAGVYGIQSLRPLINGRPLNRTTGLERIDRAVIISGPRPSDVIGKLIAVERPVLLMKGGDELSFEVGHFEKLKTYPTILCDTKLKFLRKLDDQSKGEIASVLKAYEWLDDASGNPRVKDRWPETCRNFESQLDLDNPRRSPLLKNLASDDHRLFMLNIIRAWIESPSETTGGMVR